MISKILIANRGEIACRIMRTARRMGIATVAVYSDADCAALHVRMADEAVRIGPAPAAQSYLDMASVLRAAKASGADAIHPGYGFLSENPAFVEAVEAEGLTFIGPSAAAIRAMGLKDAAKQLMEKAKVPVVPGYHGDAQELVVLAGKANEIGFPVLIKARAGGGGKGMRKVEEPGAFAAALSSAKREAKASFGDERVLVEKYVATPRHIEIQVFGDSHGNVVHLFERDCSAQRRHQKVIEEAPAPGMTEEMRAAMGDAAVAAAKAIDYRGAGTVEFIVDASEGLRPDRFWFMEMNTRLQVEHPVTELITGVDLVEWQIRVARGERLPLAQDELAINGHAVEARIYAEDAARGFLPATGTIGHLSFGSGMRVDSGVVAGDAITPFYDPMIAKGIVHAPSRSEALDGLAGALARTEIAGTVTNLSFLIRLLRQDDFACAQLDTGLIDRHLAALTDEKATPPGLLAMMALAASGMVPTDAAEDAPTADIGPWAHWVAPRRTVRLERGGEICAYVVCRPGASQWTVSGEGLADGITLSQLEIGDNGQSWSAVIDGVRRRMRIIRLAGSVTGFAEGASHERMLPKAVRSDLAAAGGDQITAPMPGVVKQVLASAGQAVVADEPLVIMEAMKMEMTLTAPRDGEIAEVLVSADDQVSDGAVLIMLTGAADAG
ncbi:acetyl/propionyl/methylcrotonyl-CoA carboxylase subunit alpha [Pseudohoeflea coraliihabitans]|uniref:Acetyl/propionyl/methylcrotonyl-CoA carboxylase subunit alpha n=1 Tax=Pseudohoeflea coraliihabitans TaxID=2860393 RepID=A0ABS6WIU5_9HYPH|nr:acetyl/propionyl/methylcrotonyl-CoA carboxylase subunit alpha [Pseudohoeflea sp. DP4N28-3]MBW3095785.1 acetyl/propionyl/methylcrotonyl-CoA carboxylase subunit alpha [Pseudohoeflea sp. DP4N28-3]